MKIIIITDHLGFGGVERFAINLTNGIVNEQHEAELFLLLEKPREMAAQLDERVAVHTMGLRYFKTLFPLLARFPALVQYIRKTNCDLIISAKPIPSVIALLACILAGKHKKLVIRVSENCQKVIDSSTGIRKVFFLLTYSYLYRAAARIIAVSEQTSRDIAALIHRPPEQVPVIYNPIVTPQLIAGRQQLSGHPWLEQKTLPVILAVGRFAQEKNFGLLLRAFAQLRSLLDCRLILLGDGIQREMLTCLAEDLGISGQISMPGFVDNPYAYMAQSDLFVLSSDHEALANVLIEAMACGCPVVSTDCPSGAREVLEDGAYGALVPVNDPHALAQAMHHALQSVNEKDRRSLQKKAEEFSQAKAVQQYLALASP